MYALICHHCSYVGSIYHITQNHIQMLEDFNSFCNGQSRGDWKKSADVLQVCSMWLFRRHNEATYCTDKTDDVALQTLCSAAFHVKHTEPFCLLWISLPLFPRVLYSCAVRQFHCGCHINIHLYCLSVNHFNEADFSQQIKQKKKSNGGTPGRGLAKKASMWFESQTNNRCLLISGILTENWFCLK